MPYVLVVDDEEAIRKLLTRWLAGWGFESREAANANEALEQMSREPATIMLCDVMMPVHDGIWLAGQVRDRWPETAIVMASSAQDMELSAAAATIHQSREVQFICMTPSGHDHMGAG